MIAKKIKTNDYRLFLLTDSLEKRYYDEIFLVPIRLSRGKGILDNFLCIVRLLNVDELFPVAIFYENPLIRTKNIFSRFPESPNIQVYVE